MRRAHISETPLFRWILETAWDDPGRSLHMESNKLVLRLKEWPELEPGQRWIDRVA